MKKLIFFICLLIPILSFAQDQEETQVYRIVEEMPEFPGGIDSLYKFLSANIHYPADALNDSVQGTVYIQFVVKKTGEVANAEVVRGVNESLDNEALRVMGIMPIWTPGRQRGKPVDVFFTLPIKYKL